MANEKNDPQGQTIPENPETSAQATAQAAAEQPKRDGRKKNPSDPTVVPFQLVSLANRQRLAEIGKPNDATLNTLLDAYERTRHAQGNPAEEDKTINALQDEIKNLKLQLQEAHSANSAGASEQQKLEQEIADLKQQITAKEQEIAAKEQDLAAATVEIAENQQTITNLQQAADASPDGQAIADLKAKLQQMTARAQKAEQDSKDLQQLVNGLNETKRELNKQLKNVQDDLNEAQQRYLEFEREATEESANRYPEGDILHFFPPITARYLELTAQRLSAVRTDGKEITPQMILGDMFNRYTIDQFNLWFYKWVISDRELIEIAQEENEKITSKRLLRAALGIK